MALEYLKKVLASGLNVKKKPLEDELNSLGGGASKSIFMIEVADSYESASFPTYNDASSFADPKTFLSFVADSSKILGVDYDIIVVHPEEINNRNGHKVCSKANELVTNVFGEDTFSVSYYSLMWANNKQEVHKVNLVCYPKWTNPNENPTFEVVLDKYTLVG